MTLRNNVRAVRYQLHLTQKQLAEHANVGISTISDIERGTYAPGVDIAILVAHTLKCTVEDIFWIDEKR